MKLLFDGLGAILCIVGMLLVGNKKWYGFIVTGLCSCSYFVLAIILGLPFLLVLNCIMFCIHMRNLKKWYGERKT